MTKILSTIAHVAADKIIATTNITALKTERDFAKAILKNKPPKNLLLKHLLKNKANQTDPQLRRHCKESRELAEALKKRFEIKA